MEIEFEPWPKIARLNRDAIITEKIDGTNAAVIVTDDLRVGAQSRNRLITPEVDNFGFAGWVARNAETLASLLGPGRHFGEWWGSGIQRRYGLAGGDKRFSLFNVHRWQDTDLSEIPELDLVPVLAEGKFTSQLVTDALDDLRQNGSQAAHGFDRPEGVVVFMTASREMYKVTLEGDEVPKALLVK